MSSEFQLSNTMEIVQKSAKFGKTPLLQRLALKATFIFLLSFAGKLRNQVQQLIRFRNQLTITYQLHQKMIKNLKS